MKTKLILIFFSFVGVLAFQNCSSGGGGGGSAGGSSTPTITVSQPPIVVAKNTDGSSGEVNVGAAISIIFSTAIDPLTLNTSTFTVSGVSGTVAYNSGTKTATFTPSSSLAYGTTYTATITTGVKDTGGNAILNNFTWSFTTQQSSSGSPGTPTLLGGAIQGNPLNPVPNIVTSLAGSNTSTGSTDSTGVAARFNYPYGNTTDGTNVYVADGSNHTIRKIVIATGAVTTLAGSPMASGSADGTGSAARFNYPYGITTDGTNLYVADTSNHTIRMIVIATGAVTTLAGSAGSFGSTDGTGTAARFQNPHGITTDGTNLYIANSGNHTIRKIVIATGVVTTLAGDPITADSTDGIGTAARFNYPYGITTDGTNLYVVDGSNHTIRKIVIATTAVTTLAGSALVTGATDGTGSAARFNYPYGITTDGTNLYITDKNNHTIRKLVIATRLVTTIAGAGYTGYGDGTGTAAVFASPHGITTDGTNLIVTDSGNHTLRKISPITSAPSSAPGGLVITPGDGQAIFSWSNVTGATSYNLYCAAGPSVTTTTGTKIAKIASPYYLGSYWTATPIVVQNGTNFTCIVTAVNSVGESVASSPVTITPEATYLLSVSVVGTVNGSGTVTSSPSGISCGSVCAANVTNGASITLTATPASGSTFTGWSGDCSGTGTCTLTMNSDRSAVANFLGTATPPPGVSISASPSSVALTATSCSPSTCVVSKTITITSSTAWTSTVPGFGSLPTGYTVTPSTGAAGSTSVTISYSYQIPLPASGFIRFRTTTIGNYVEVPVTLATF